MQLLARRGQLAFELHNLARLVFVNQIIENGEQAYGPDFLTRINDASYAVEPNVVSYFALELQRRLAHIGPIHRSCSRQHAGGRQAYREPFGSTSR